MKIVFFEIEEWEKEHLKNELKDFEVSFFTEKLTKENAGQVKDADIICGFIDSVVDEEILSQLPNIRMITTRSTGFDQINLEACKKRDITVCNVPHYGDNTVAEHTFALILDLSRKVHNSIEAVKKEGFSVKGLVGFDLQGKTLGVIGTGRIGSHVIRIAKGFEMNVLAYDIYQDKKLAKKLGFHYATLEEVLKSADIISIHTPYNKDTHHLINLGNIGLIKKGAYLINTARGGIVETQALVIALDDGILAGAGLDVLEEEKFLREESQLLSQEFSTEYDVKTVLQDHILMERENVIITPHNAFNSREALLRILETTVENIQAFTKNKPINTVT